MSAFRDTGHLEWSQPITTEASTAYKNIHNKFPYGSHEDVKGFYENWSKTYDSDVSALNYAVPDVIADKAEKLADADGKASWSILDVGAGTGLIGKKLREKGFKGEITALDYSKGMLENAMQLQDVYSSDILHAVTPDSPIPVPDCTYDIVCCTGMLYDSIEAICLQDMMRILKPGGYFINTIRVSKAAKAYRATLASIKENLINEEKMKEVSVEEFVQYQWKIKDPEKSTESLMGEIMVYCKI